MCSEIETGKRVQRDKWWICCQHLASASASFSDRLMYSLYARLRQHTQSTCVAVRNTEEYGGRGVCLRFRHLLFRENCADEGVSILRGCLSTNSAEGGDRIPAVYRSSVRALFSLKWEGPLVS